MTAGKGRITLSQDWVHLQFVEHTNNKTPSTGYIYIFSHTHTETQTYTFPHTWEFRIGEGLEAGCLGDDGGRNRRDGSDRIIFPLKAYFKKLIKLSKFKKNQSYWYI